MFVDYHRKNVLKNKLLLTFLLIAVSLCPLFIVAQTRDTFATYSVSAYADVYGATYTDSVGHGNFQKFPTVSPRSNTVGLNVVQVSGKYDGQRIRGMVTLHYGDIEKATWPKNYHLLQEAHVGVRLLKTLWVDGGFFRTHFGTEFLLPVENITSSVSVGTYFEPYYEAGLRLNYDPTDKLEINLFLLNGYGIIADNNKRKSFGMGITYAFSKNLNIGYTNYIGNDAPDSITMSQVRFANNIFINYKKKKLKLQAGADVYIHQHADLIDNSKVGIAYSGLITIRYQLLYKFWGYGRAEGFYDNNGFLCGVITDTKGNQTGYKQWGVTLGMEYKPMRDAYIRLEGRRLQMADGQAIFRFDGENRDYRYELMLNAGMSLSLLKGVLTRN